MLERKKMMELRKIMMLGLKKMMLEQFSHLNTSDPKSHLLKIQIYSRWVTGEAIILSANIVGRSCRNPNWILKRTILTYSTPGVCFLGCVHITMGHKHYPRRLNIIL